MQCWGVGPFENQFASDWLEALLCGETHPDAAIAAVQGHTGSVALELACQVLAACTLAGNTLPRTKMLPMPQAAWRWLDESGFDCQVLTRNDYRSALHRVATGSALDERMRATTEYVEWRAVLVRIEQRFTPLPRLKFLRPDYAGLDEPFWYWRLRQPGMYRALRRGDFGVDRRAFERLRIELQCGVDSVVEPHSLQQAALIGNRQLQLNGLGRLDDLSLENGTVRFRTHRGMQRDALRLLTAVLRPLGLPRDGVFFHAGVGNTGPFNLARRLYPQRLTRHEGVPGTCLTKLIASLRFQRPGNIFCYQAVPGFWHYGRVMAIDADVGVGRDCLLLHFYRESSMAKTQLPDFDLSSLLLPPVVCDREPWALGMLQTIDRIRLTDSERSAVGSRRQHPVRLDEAADALPLSGEPDATLTTQLFSKPLEIDELICLAHDVPLSPLEME